AVPPLENAWENSFDNLIQQRIENIIHKIQFDNLFVELKKWSQNNYKDLLHGFILLSQYQYPDLDKDKITRQISQIIQDIWLELNNYLTALEKIKVINHILFDIHKFTSNKSNIYTPEKFFINNLLESKKGNPISLGMLYIIIAQSLKMPVYGVNLPKHFILAYSDEIKNEKFIVVKKDEVLFYINPYNKGAVFTRKEIELFLKQLSLKPDKKYFNPCDNITIAKRFVNELLTSYEKLGHQDKIYELKKLRKAFDK
ncbi:MAG: transglutaminase family protein, partial [Bacteroidales bacterium]|nr:transglutaminase family protein [Bacteroidales bacterium]